MEGWRRRVAMEGWPMGVELLPLITTLVTAGMDLTKLGLGIAALRGASAAELKAVLGPKGKREGGV
jgi:hypothetical protein